MTALALERPGVRGREAAREERRPSADRGGESSLDAVLSGMWEGLAAHRSVACPLCGGEVVPVYGVHARPIGGRCGGCETRIS